MIFIVKDDSKQLRDPTPTEVMLYCRPVPIIKPEDNCTALVAIQDPKNNENVEIAGGESRVKSMISSFESFIVNPLTNFWNNAAKSGLFKTKEEGIKINVKKNNHEEKKQEEVNSQPDNEAKNNHQI